MANKKVQQRGAQGKRAAEKNQMLKDQQVLDLFARKSVVRVTFTTFFDLPEKLKEELYDLFEPVLLVKVPTDSGKGLSFYLYVEAEQKMFDLFQLTDRFINVAFSDGVECVFIKMMEDKPCRS